MGYSHCLAIPGEFVADLESRSSYRSARAIPEEWQRLD